MAKKYHFMPNGKKMLGASHPKPKKKKVKKKKGGY